MTTQTSTATGAATDLHRWANGTRPDRFLRKPQVVAMTGLSASTIDRMIRDERFPRPTKLSTRCVGWPESVIQSWMVERAADCPDHAA